MKKTFAFIIGILAVVMFISLGSAALTISNTPSSLSREGGNFNFTVNTNLSSNFNISITSNLDGLTSTTTKTVVGNDTKVTLNYNTSDANFENVAKTYDIEIKVTNKTNSTDTASKTINFQDYDYCGDTPNLNDNGNIQVSVDDVKTLGGYGDSDTWYINNKMQISFQVDNNANYDLRSGKLYWAIYTTSGTRIDSGNSDSFSLNSGDEKKIYIEFTLDSHLNDLLDSNLILHAKVEGKAYDNNEDYNGNKTCDSYTEKGYSVDGNDFVIPSDIFVNGVHMNNTNNMIYNQNISCESSVTLTGNLYNIGDSDQSDSYLTIYSPELNVSKVIMFDRIDSLDTESFTYTFKIPSEITQKLYPVALKVYDDNNDVYQDTNGHDAVKYVYLNVYGNCVFIAPSVSAKLSGQARAGRLMTINTTIVNNQNKQMTYDLSLEGTDSFATSASISPSVLVIPAHETLQAQIKMNLKDDSVGTQDFNIIVKTGERKLVTQPVTVTVEKKGFKISDWFNGSVELLIFVIVDAIILIAIILVAIKLSRRKK